MPLSGAAMISENTAADASSRFAGSLSAASSGVSATVVATVAAITNLTLHLLLPLPTVCGASFNGCFFSQVTRPVRQPSVAASPEADPTSLVFFAAVPVGPFRPFAGFWRRVCDEP
jgi:hypothetical protein